MSLPDFSSCTDVSLFDQEIIAVVLNQYLGAICARLSNKYENGTVVSIMCICSEVTYKLYNDSGRDGSCENWISSGALLDDARSSQRGAMLSFA